MATQSAQVPVFAIGLGFRNEVYVDYSKAFQQREARGKDKGNVGAVQDFMRIMQERLEYIEGHAIIDLCDVDLEALYDVFMETNHKGSAEFIEQAMQIDPNDLKDAIICIMSEDKPPTGMEEQSLLQKLRVDAEPLPEKLV